MQQICDLYIPQTLNDYSPLKYLHLFDPKFLYRAEQQYQGYLNVNVRRVALVNFVLEFRKWNMQIYNVPIQYRDQQNLSIDQAFEYALKAIDLEKYSISKTDFMEMDCPIYWRFPLINLHGEEKTGAGINVDKLDGHIWTMEEMEEYKYDFNCLI